MKKGEIVFFAICVAFFGFMFYEGLDLAGQGRAGEIGSGLWPLLAIGASALFSVALLISSVKKYRGEGTAEDRTPEAIAEKKTAADHRDAERGHFSDLHGGDSLARFHSFDPDLHPGLCPGLGRETQVGPARSRRFCSPRIIVAVFAKFITIPFPKGVGIFAEFSRLFY